MRTDCADQLALFLPAFIVGAAGAPHVVELRVLDVPQRYGKPRTEAGFFDLASPKGSLAFRTAVRSYTDRPAVDQPPGVYVTMNPVDPIFLARANNAMGEGTRKISAEDAHVGARHWLVIDGDPKRRIAGISASAEEKDAALKLAGNVRVDLHDRGFAPPMLIDSGNGYHLWYRIELPADDGGIVERCLKALADKHDTAGATVDTSIFNPSRIIKIPGTWARKGSDLPDRPHRMGRVLEVPEGGCAVTPRELLEALAAECPPEQLGGGKKKVPSGSHRAEPVAASPVPPSLPTRSYSDNRVSRCRSYLAKLAPSVEGQKGSDRIFQAARLIWNDFGVDGAAGYDLLLEFNLNSAPPWEEEGTQGLRRKWDEAVSKGPDRQGWRAEQVAPGSNGNGKRAPAPVPAPAADKPPKYKLIDSEEFRRADFKVEWLVDWFLAKGEPTVVAGPSKAMKTSVLVDLAVSLATATPHLGKWNVPRRVRVAIVSGESGGYTLQETFFRVLRAKGLTDDACDGLLKWEFTLPTFSDLVDTADFADRLGALECEVVIIDPLYLTLGAVDAKNMFEMGPALRAVAELLIRKHKVTPIIAHHANRTLPAGEMMELQHLAYSGLEQFLAQYVFLSRRTPYQNDGVHDLWYRFGGRPGHSGLDVLTINEGVLGPDNPSRKWEVSVDTAGAIRAADRADAQEQRKAAKIDTMNADDNAVLGAVEAEVSSGEPAATMNRIRVITELSYDRAVAAKDRLLKQDAIKELKWKKAGQRVTGWLLSAE